MPISAKWKHKSSIHIGFIVFNGGVTTFFAKSVFYIDEIQVREYFCSFSSKSYYFYILGVSHLKRASPTHGGRWLAQTNYDALMTFHTT